MNTRMTRFVLAAVILLGAAGAVGYLTRPQDPPQQSTIMKTVPTRTPTAPPTGTARATSTPMGRVDLRVEPRGYAQGCGAAEPWGKQVAKPFICIEAPKTGTVVGREFVVYGYAGGSFENNVVMEWQLQRENGSLTPAVPAKLATTYAAPDIGMPGLWSFSFNLGTDAPGMVRVTAYFESPRDGARVAEAKLEFRAQ